MPPEIGAMSTASAGPPRAGGGHWIDGHIGMGGAFSVDPDGPLVVAGAIRLDNAATLVSRLDLAARPRPNDAEVVLAAYTRWGETVADQLEGDFAFGLWDGRRRLLVCARDGLGVEPLYYHLGPKTFAFAGDADALLGLPDVPRRVNAAAIADFLNASFDDTVTTGFLDISRLPPGRSVVVDGEGTRSHMHWSPGPRDERRMPSDDEYEAAFRSALTQAVGSRFGPGPVGVSLSGGLDSSSLTCIAGSLRPDRLVAISAVFDNEPRSDERAWAAAVVARSGAVARTCHPERTSPLAEWEGASWKGVTPACTPQISVCRTTLEAAAQEGVGVMLHGFGGDSVVSHGMAYLTELVGSGHLLRAVRETEALHRRHGRSRRLLWRRALGPLLPPQLLRHRAPPPGLLRPDMVRERTPARAARTAQEDQLLELGAGIVPAVLEASRRLDAVTGVSRRYPFLDRRLVELCISLPGDQKLRDGWTRSIMRRSLADLLPEEVRLRPGKTDLGHAFVRSLATGDRPILDFVATHPGALTEWVDPAALDELWGRCRAGGTSGEWFTLWRAAVTSLWLRHHRFDDPLPAELSRA